MKAVVAAFNQEKALVGAFSVITNLRMELFQALPASVTQFRCGSDVTAAINGYFESVALSHIRDIVTYWQPADGHVPASHPSRVTCHARGNTGPGLVTDIYMHSGLMALYNCLTTLNLIKINSRIKILSFLSAALSW